MSRRRIYVGLGGNVGQPYETFQQALVQLQEMGIGLLRISAYYQTAPVGPIPQPDYLNAVAELETELPALTVQSILQETERKLGRDRTQELRWGPRTLDLDYLLDEEGPAIDTPTLILPHPRMWKRAFVLVPLAELRPDLVGPDGREIEAVANGLLVVQDLTKVDL